jgi:hypothetical protein
MSARTIFLAKLMGLVLAAVGLSILIQGPQMASLVDRFMHDQPLVWVTSIITFACGLAILLAHNQWSGGALPVVVTILGCLLTLKGLFLLLLPPAIQINLVAALQFARFVYLFGAIDLAIGIYLIIAAFAARKAA